MIILFLLFLIQFSIAASCLAVSRIQQQQFAEEGWNNASNDIKKNVQDNFLCCGFNATDTLNASTHPSCENIAVSILLHSAIDIEPSPSTLTVMFFFVFFCVALVLCTKSGSIWLHLSAVLTKIIRRNKLRI